MVDISSPSFIWEDLAYRIGRGEHPPAPELARIVVKALGAQGVPSGVAEYIGARVRGDIRLKGADHRPARPRTSRWSRAILLRDDVQIVQAAFRLQAVPKPKERALVVVGMSCGFKPSTVETIIKRDLHDAPDGMKRRRSIEEVESQVRQWVAGGEYRYDESLGLVTVPDDPGDDT